MSYCRWSSMNWMCDVYVYEDVSFGYTIHVAGNKPVFPPIPDLLVSPVSMWVHNWAEVTYNYTTQKLEYKKPWKRHIYNALSKFFLFWHNTIHTGTLRLIPRRNLHGPYAGVTLRYGTPEDCASSLRNLRKLGYSVPDYAIEQLEAKAKQERSC